MNAHSPTIEQAEASHIELGETPVEHEADLAGFAIRRANRKLIEAEAHEHAHLPGEAFALILAAERELRQAERHIARLKDRFGFDYGLTDEPEPTRAQTYAADVVASLEAAE